MVSATSERCPLLGPTGCTAYADRPIDESLRLLAGFSGTKLSATLAGIERAAQGLPAERLAQFVTSVGTGPDHLRAAQAVKALAGEINTAIHALGILHCLPFILEPGETVEAISLGAGNRGRRFDLETDRRVAEFKFNAWRGQDARRLQSMFKDFVLLAEHDTAKRRQLYLHGTAQALAFLRGRRALASLVPARSREAALLAPRISAGDTVAAYLASMESRVEVLDVTPWMASAGFAAP